MAVAEDQETGVDDDAPVGESIEERAANEPDQQPLFGTADLISGDAGGEDPQSATIKLRGGSLPLEGSFQKGEVVRMWVEFRVGEVHLVDSLDKFGNVVGTERRHIGVMRRVTRADS